MCETYVKVVTHLKGLCCAKKVMMKINWIPFSLSVSWQLSQALSTFIKCVFMYMWLLQVLDEVERRRALSPALVQPFMRAIMEAQFPAPGRTITIKTFLPGSGTEVSDAGGQQ